MSVSIIHPVPLLAFGSKPTCTLPSVWQNIIHYDEVIMTTMASQITMQPHGCWLNRLFRRRSKKTPKLRVTGLCVGNSPGPVNSPHKGPVTRKMFPFDDVIMIGPRPWYNTITWYYKSCVNIVIHLPHQTHDLIPNITTVTSQWPRWRLRSTASPWFTQPYIQALIKENVKALLHWPLCGEVIGDRWIPRTKGQ